MASLHSDNTYRGTSGNGDGTEPPPAEGISMEYVYATIAVIVTVVVAFLAFFFLKKKREVENRN